MIRLLFTALCAAALASAQGIEGDWLGTLAIPAGKLRIAVHLKQSPTGLTGTMDSLDQGALGIPVQEAAFTGGVIKFSVPSIRGSYEGKLSADGSAIEGAFTQGGATLPLPLARMTKPLEEPKRPQEPKAPFPYDAEDVTVDGGPGISLSGTLTIPKGDGKFPAAVLISGSGQQNRDSLIMGHKPFLVLADHLTRKGIAVLRYDDRGFGKSTGPLATATSADFAADASAVVAFLRKHPRIDAAKIGLIGHSEGGLIAPMIAAKDPAIAFVVMLAGQGVTGEQVMLEQAALIMKASGAPAAALEQQRSMQERIFTVVRTEADAEARGAKLREVASGLPPAAQAQIRMAGTPWFRFFLLYDPALDLKKVKCPVLALIGTLDLQVAVGQNLPVIEKALRDGGNKDFKTISLPGLNHLFQTAKSGTPSEYGEIEETFAPAALATISDWLAPRVK